MKETAGIVLAGGMSRRFGGEKSLTKINGKEMVAYSVEAFAGLNDIVIVARPDLAVKILQTRRICVISDLPQYRGKGPLAGIYSAMTEIDAEWYAVLPCDTPWIKQSVIEKLLAQRAPEWDVIVSRAGGRLQPLISVFHRRAKEKIRAKLDTGNLSMRSLFEDCRVKIIDFEQKKWFANINTKDDLK